MPANGKWDLVPIWGIFMQPIDESPVQGSITADIPNRVQRVDERVIYPAGAQLTVRIGDQAAHDVVIRSAVRTAWRAADEAAAAAAGETFDVVAWEAWWDTKIVPAAVFMSFPPVDDPDIVGDHHQVLITESLTNAPRRQYAIRPLMEHLNRPIPGINLGAMDVPPGAPATPLPVYAKGLAGGVASLDDTGKVPREQLPDDLGGGASTVDELEDASDVGKAVVKAANQAAARTAIGVATATAAAAGLVELATTAEATAGTDTVRAVTPAGVAASIAALVASSPAALDTLRELAAAMGDDPNFAATMTNALAGKVPTTRTVGGKPLTADVTLTKGDVGLATVPPIYSATPLAAGATLPSGFTGLVLRFKA